MGEKLKGKTAIELGAGPGVAGLAASLLGAVTLITDLAEVTSLTKMPFPEHKQNQKLFRLFR